MFVLVSSGSKNIKMLCFCLANLGREPRGQGPCSKNALCTLKERCSNIGLRLSTGSADGMDKGKCSVILLAGGAASNVDIGLFPSDFKVIRDGDSELLRGPIGSPDFCNSHNG